MRSTLLLSLFSLLLLSGLTSAFHVVNPAHSLASRGPPSPTLHRRHDPNILSREVHRPELQRKNALLKMTFFSELLEAINSIPEDFDLAFGMFVIFMAVSPYVLGLIIPNVLFPKFFLPVYGENDEAGRRAEIAWKLMYATQGLVLSSIIFIEAILMTDSKQALRDCYVAWALFYILAIIKIRIEAAEGIIAESRVGIQLWHSFVVIALLVDVGLRPEVVQVVMSVAA